MKYLPLIFGIINIALLVWDCINGNTIQAVISAVGAAIPIAYVFRQLSEL